MISFSSLQIRLGINHCNYATYPPTTISGSSQCIVMQCNALDPYLWWKPICPTDFLCNGIQLCRSLMESHHLCFSRSRQCKSVASMTVIMRPTPPLLSGSLDPYLWWEPMCSWIYILHCRPTDIYAIVYNCVDHSRNHTT